MEQSPYEKGIGMKFSEAPSKIEREGRKWELVGSTPNGEATWCYRDGRHYSGLHVLRDDEFQPMEVKHDE